MVGGWVGGGWVGGRLVKTDFITHSGSHQSSAWIQNPSLSRVWQKNTCVHLCGGGGWWCKVILVLSFGLTQAEQKFDFT